MTLALTTGWGTAHHTRHEHAGGKDNSPSSRGSANRRGQRRHGWAGERSDGAVAVVDTHRSRCHPALSGCEPPRALQLPSLGRLDTHRRLISGLEPVVSEIGFETISGSAQVAAGSIGCLIDRKCRPLVRPHGLVCSDRGKEDSEALCA